MRSKHKFSLFGFAAIAGLLTLGAAVKPVSKDVYLLDGVEPLPITDVMKQLANVNLFERANLVIESPGGYVSLLKVMQAKIKQGSINTEIVGEAASAAAIMFLFGHDRIMHEEATILFHEPRIIVPQFLGRPIVLTLTDIESFLVSGDLAENSLHFKDNTAEAALGILRQIPVERLVSVVESGNREVEKMRQLINKVAGTGVADEVLKPNEDIELTAEEALALGVATKVVSDDGNEGSEFSDKARPRNPAAGDK